MVTRISQLPNGQRISPTSGGTIGVDGATVGDNTAERGHFTDLLLDNPLPYGSGGTGFDSYALNQLLVGKGDTTLGLLTLTSGANITIDNNGTNLTISSTGGVNSYIVPTTLDKVGAQNALNSMVSGDTVILGPVDFAGANNRLSVGDNKYLVGGTISSAYTIDEPTLNIQGNYITISGVEIDVLQATAVQVAGMFVNDYMHVNGRIRAIAGYGWLDNNSGSGGATDGVIFNNNYVYSNADPIECNHPSTPASHRTIMGNIVNSVGLVAGGSAGFGIGIAQVNGCVIIGNQIRTARQAAIHIEDLNSRTVILGNTASACLKEGITIQVPVPGKGFPDPYVGGFNSFKHTGTKTGYAGLQIIGDSNGNVDQLVFPGNCVNGFDVGISAPDTIQFFLEGNIILNCNTAIFASKHGWAIGRISAKNTPILATGQSGSTIGPVYSVTVPTSLLTKNGGNFPGPLLEGWYYPAVFVHTGSGQEWFTIATLPSWIDGEIYTTIEGGGAACKYKAFINWDGTTMTTVREGIKSYQSPITAVAYRASGGNFQVGVTSATGFSNTLRMLSKADWLQNT